MGNRASSTNQKKHGSGTSDQRSSSPTSEASGDRSEAMVAARRFANAINSKNTLTFYQAVNQDAVFHFEDVVNLKLTTRTFWESIMMDLFEAITDLSFSFSSIKEAQKGVVVLNGFSGCGHHNGSPLVSVNGAGFKIPPTGALIKSDPVRVTLKISNGKVVGVHAQSIGGKRHTLAGPHSFYVKAMEAWEKSQRNKKCKSRKTQRKGNMTIKNSAA